MTHYRWQSRLLRRHLKPEASLNRPTSNLSSTSRQCLRIL